MAGREGVDQVGMSFVDSPSWTRRASTFGHVDVERKATTTAVGAILFILVAALVVCSLVV